jgi:hypothetical protein
VLALIRLENKGITVKKADGKWGGANRKKGGKDSTAGVDGYEGALHMWCDARKICK